MIRDDTRDEYICENILNLEELLEEVEDKNNYNNLKKEEVKELSGKWRFRTLHN